VTVLNMLSHSSLAAKVDSSAGVLLSSFIDSLSGCRLFGLRKTGS
jgi:hypothetical protein